MVVLSGLGLAATIGTDGPEAIPGTELPKDLRRDNAAVGTGPTGWYLPALPDGWSITKAEVVEPAPATRVRAATDGRERPCACESVTWVHPGDGRGITATMQPGDSTDILMDQFGSDVVDTEPVPFDWVDGVVGRIRAQAGDEPDRDLRILMASDGANVLAVAGEARDRKTMHQMAVDWVRNGLRELVQDVGAPEGWRLHALGGTRIEGEAPFVRVSLRGPRGTGSYDLVPTGSRPFLPGASLGASKVGPAFAASGTGSAVIEAQGAEIFAGTTTGDLSQGELNKVLIGSLRPASSAAWRTALDDVPHPAGLETAGLAGTVTQVVVGEQPSIERTPVPAQRLTGANVDGLDLAVDLWATDVVAGEPIGADVLVTNTTEEPIRWTECNESSFTWGLVPAEDVAAELPGRGFVDCYESLRYTIPPGSTLRRPTEYGIPTDTRTSMLSEPVEALGPGAYRAVVELGGSRSVLRSTDPRTIVLRPSTCPEVPEVFASSSESAGPAVGTYSEAVATAKAAGLDFRVLKPGGDPGPVECDRITGYLAPGDGFLTFTRS